MAAAAARATAAAKLRQSEADRLGSAHDHSVGRVHGLEGQRAGTWLVSGRVWVARQG
jgi:hypothetical protein